MYLYVYPILTQEVIRMGIKIANEFISKLKIIADHYGYAEQKDQTNEEMAELTVALNKFKRYGKTQRKTRLKAIITELADVYIMINQLTYLLKCEDEVNKEIEYKVDRALRDIDKQKEKAGK